LPKHHGLISRRPEGAWSERTTAFEPSIRTIGNLCLHARAVKHLLGLEFFILQRMTTIDRWNTSRALTQGATYKGASTDAKVY